MAARKLNRESVDGPGLVLAQGPEPTSRLGGEIADGPRLPRW
jgi:hypothetical protein